jgi:hypothetical protein
MTIGPGKYDAECTMVREATGASAVIVIVLGGSKGGGLSVQTSDPDLLFSLPEYLREVAKGIERDLGDML